MCARSSHTVSLVYSYHWIYPLEVLTPYYLSCHKRFGVVNLYHFVVCRTNLLCQQWDCWSPVVWMCIHLNELFDIWSWCRWKCRRASFLPLKHRCSKFCPSLPNVPIGWRQLRTDFYLSHLVVVFVVFSSFR